MASQQAHQRAMQESAQQNQWELFKAQEEMQRMAAMRQAQSPILQALLNSSAPIGSGRGYGY
jgi:hypothetical protein